MNEEKIEIRVLVDREARDKVIAMAKKAGVGEGKFAEFAGKLITAAVTK